ncbi:MAG TPA: hypothetical protein VET66_14530 [Steroidobacteraceae bacterium]|nr:hypothetical protein [Steroidobacteraceae bacterium]
MTPLPRPLQRPERKGHAAGAHVARLSARNGASIMPLTLRLAVYALFGLLWGSGVLWLVLHFGFAQQGPFGALPNPWEPALMRVHGLLAVGAVFLLGWIGGGHVLARWHSGRNRRSGLVLASSGALLIASGYALYYSTGVLHDIASATHEWLGVAVVSVALAHWWRMRATR